MSRRRRDHVHAMGRTPDKVRVEIGVLLKQAQHDLNRGNLEGAKAIIKLLLEQNRRNFDAWLLAALLAESQGDFDLMVDCLQRVLELNPGNYAASLNLGAHYWSHHEPERAIAVLEPACAAWPDRTKLWNNLGNAYRDVDRHEDAIAAYTRCLEVGPHPEARFNRSLSLLMLGRDEEGWKDYQARWMMEGYESEWMRPHLYRPAWDGKAPGRVLLWAEQGVGDVIQMLRYVPWVRARAGLPVLLEVPRALKRLCWIQFRDGIADVVAQGENVPRYDWQASIMSLPALLGASPPPALRFRAEEGDAITKVGADMHAGIVWAGNKHHKNDRWRSTELVDWLPLLSVPGVRWHSLQVGERAKDMEPLEEDGLVIDCSPIIGDWADTANVLAAMDLVITVDTATAHLAGAMGRPTWMLVAAVPDYRWRRTDGTTAWYPSMRLFRQEQRGNWKPVIQRIRTALRRELNLGEEAA